MLCSADFPESRQMIAIPKLEGSFPREGIPDVSRARMARLFTP